MSAVNTALASPIPPSYYFNAINFAGAVKRRAHRRGRMRKRRKMKGGFLSGIAAKAGTRVVDHTFRRLGVNNAKDIADIATKSLINNAIDIPQQRFKRYKRSKINALKRFKNRQLKKLPKFIRNRLTCMLKQ